MLRYWEPRFDPALRPRAWKAARRRRRGIWALIVLSILVIGTVGFLLYPRDPIWNLSATAIVQAAGNAILEADGYRFSVQLSGESADKMFPSATMQGEYRRKPRVLHLVGEAVSGGAPVPLEYYLADRALYVRDPRDQSWMLLRETDVDELHSFQPDNLASPLLTALRGATLVGREQLEGNEAVELRLDLDPEMMQPRVGEVEFGQVEYSLWVYTQTLDPARLVIEYKALSPGTDPRQVLSFSYVLSLDFRHRTRLTVPVDVVWSAREVKVKPPLDIPGRP